MHQFDYLLCRNRILRAECRRKELLEQPQSPQNYTISRSNMQETGQRDRFWAFSGDISDRKMSRLESLRKSINFEFTLALTNVRSLAEDGIMDRMHAIRMGSPWRFTIKVRMPIIMI
jgi:hypothetical protein